MTVSENVILILLFLLIFNKYESKFYFYLVVGEATNIKMFLSAEVTYYCIWWIYVSTSSLYFSETLNLKSLKHNRNWDPNLWPGVIRCILAFYSVLFKSRFDQMPDSAKWSELYIFSSIWLYQSMNFDSDDMLMIKKEVKLDIYLKRILSLMIFIMWVSWNMFMRGVPIRLKPNRPKEKK